MDLAEACYQKVKAFPKDQLFGLTCRIRRASSSIPANVAEEQGRNSSGEFIHFLGIGRGSLFELETHLLLSCRTGLIGTKDSESLMELSGRVSRMLSRLVSALNDRRE